MFLSTEGEKISVDVRGRTARGRDICESPK